MNAFTRHPKQQGISYAEHGAFAIGIAWRLAISALAFAIHGLLPFIGIQRQLDLEATAAYLAERNRFIESAAAAARRRAPAPEWSDGLTA